MATKKDLVEAYSFSRRRLVTAFVSGAPGGREVEPARPGRTIVGGLALSVLLVAGAAIAGVFASTAPNDWKSPGLIISTDTGAAYVITDEDDPELRPVSNMTSAKLILGADAKPRMIAQKTIDDQRIGNDIGIFGAPASLPTPSLLIDSGWTACTAAQAGIRVRIAEQPDTTAVPRLGLTVVSEGKYYVVVPTDSARPGAEHTGAYVYPVPPQGRGGKQTDNLLAALHLQPMGKAVPVSREWINLFPAGAPLTWSSFELKGLGKTPTYAAQDAAGVLQDHKVGDLLEAGTEKLLLTDSGPIALSDFAAAVYTQVVAPDNSVAQPMPVDTAPRVPRDTTTLADAHWPESLPEDSMDEPCAQLTAEHGRAPVADLVAPGEASSGEGVPAGQKDPVVAPGRGAYVLSGGWGDTDDGAPFVIDGKGRANPLVGADAPSLLGYDGYPVAVVPDTWVKLFGCGVNLSKEPDDSACL